MSRMVTENAIPLCKIEVKLVGIYTLCMCLSVHICIYVGINLMIKVIVVEYKFTTFLRSILWALKRLHYVCIYKTNTV